MFFSSLFQLHGFFPLLLFLVKSLHLFVMGFFLCKHGIFFGFYNCFTFCHFSIKLSIPSIGLCFFLFPYLLLQQISFGCLSCYILVPLRLVHDWLILFFKCLCGCFLLCSLLLIELVWTQVFICLLLICLLISIMIILSTIIFDLTLITIFGCHIFVWWLLWCTSSVASYKLWWIILTLLILSQKVCSILFPLVHICIFSNIVCRWSSSSWLRSQWILLLLHFLNIG